MKRSINSAIAAGVLVAFTGAAHAATKTDGFVVSATVTKNCVISAADLDLGTFDGTNDLTVNSDIDIRCTSGTAYTVDLSTGLSGNYTNRTLVNGTDTLVYNLYTTSGYATVWGDNTGGSGRPAAGSGAGMGTVQTLTVYGRLLASQNTGPIPANTYADNITATITY